MGQALGALNSLILLAIVLAVLGVAAYLVIQYAFGKRRTAALPNAPLAIKPKPIMTEAERAFFHTLQNALTNRYEIFPQVPFSSLVAQTGKLPPEVWGIVQNSHADFVLAHPKFLGAIAVIELDDSSHQQATTRAKDEIKNRICADAKIPLLRFRVGEKWDSNEIRLQVERIADLTK